MAGRPTQKKADIKAIQTLSHRVGNVLDSRPIIAYTMRKCGCTYAEIAQVFSITRQMAETIYKNAEKEL